MPTACLTLCAVHRKKVRWRFRKMLWPSQKIWTSCGKATSKSRAVCASIFWARFWTKNLFLEMFLFLKEPCGIISNWRIVIKHCRFHFNFHFGQWSYYVIMFVYFFYWVQICKARWARQKFKTEHVIKKILQLKWLKYEKTKLGKWNEPNISHLNFKSDMIFREIRLF